MTKHHVIAALIDAGMAEDDAETWVIGIGYRARNEIPNWRQALLDARGDALEEGTQFDRAYDNLIERA